MKVESTTSFLMILFYLSMVHAILPNTFNCSFPATTNWFMDGARPTNLGLGLSVACMIKNSVCICSSTNGNSCYRSGTDRAIPFTFNGKQVCKVQACGHWTMDPSLGWTQQPKCVIRPPVDERTLMQPLNPQNALPLPTQNRGNPLMNPGNPIPNQRLAGQALPPPTQQQPLPPSIQQRMQIPQQQPQLPFPMQAH